MRESRDSDGARFIEHPLEVARLLRAAGCSDVVVAAGLLHDVLEHTAVTADTVRHGSPRVAKRVLVARDPGLEPAKPSTSDAAR